MASYPTQGDPICVMDLPVFNKPELGHEGHPTYYRGYASPPKSSIHAGMTDTDDPTETAADERKERD
jgi:hypothetical protein